MDGIGLVIFGRILFALVALALAVVAGFLFATIITANGATWLHFAQVCLLIVCCMWLAWGFNTAVAGIFFSRGKPNRRGGVLAPASVNRSAVLVPVYNEDADAVMARVAAMIEGLRRIRRLEAFDFFVLSDSTKPESVAAERRAVFEIAGALETGTHLYYRHREKNTNRKAGNIGEFVTQQGGAYTYMIVLDADSLMRPETLVEMVARMDDDDELALLQTQPLIINRRSLFGRALQFSAALYSPFFSRGIAALQGREGPFWGHNAIIRTRAFAQSCGLPHLSGRPPFGGHILSHDFVEAALLARDGWKVRVDPDLEGSFEEAPSNLIEYAKRDRRWCQGNLQHGRLAAQLLEAGIEAEGEDELPGERIEEPSAGIGIVGNVEPRQADDQPDGNRSDDKPFQPDPPYAEQHERQHQQQRGIQRQDIQVAELVSEGGDAVQRIERLRQKGAQPDLAEDISLAERQREPDEQRDDRHGKGDVHEIENARAPGRLQRCDQRRALKEEPPIGESAGDAGQEDEDFGRVGKAEIAAREIFPQNARYVVDEDHHQRHAAEKIDPVVSLRTEKDAVM